MLDPVLSKDDSQVRQNPEQSPNNHSNHLMIEYFQDKEIDYTSKPLTERESRSKLRGYNIQATALNGKKIHQVEIISAEKQKRTRLVVKKGPENIPMPLGRIALFCMEKKIVYAFHEDGNKYIVEENLTALEQALNEKTFFRANRQYIININYIKSFRTYERVKLKIDMIPDDINDRHSIIISQETAPAFKKWIHSA